MNVDVRNLKPGAPVDPNVFVPPAVRAAAAAAEAAQNKFIAEQQGAAAPIAADAQSPAPPLAVTEASAATQETQPSPAAQDPALTPGVSQPQEPQPSPPTVPEETWEARYRSMEGRFQKQIRELSEQNDSLIQSLAMLRTQRVAEPTPEPDEPPARLISDQEVTEYGPEFIDVVRRAASEQFRVEARNYQKQIKQLEQQVQGVSTVMQASTTRDVYSHLERELPNWRQQNDDPRFIEWLKLRDPYSGAIRLELLREAFGQFNAPRVIAFFKGFLAEEAATARPGSSPGTSPAPAQPATGKVPLEALAAPGRATSAAGTSAPAEKPIFTRAEITQFYSDVARGKWRGKEKEQAAKDQQIFAAEREGRIR